MESNRRDNSKPIVFSEWLENAFSAMDKKSVLKNMERARAELSPKLQYRWLSTFDFFKIILVIGILLLVAYAIFSSFGDRGVAPWSSSPERSEIWLINTEKTSEEYRKLERNYSFSQAMNVILLFLMVAASVKSTLSKNARKG